MVELAREVTEEYGTQPAFDRGRAAFSPHAEASMLADLSIRCGVRSVEFPDRMQQP